MYGGRAAMVVVPRKYIEDACRTIHREVVSVQFIIVHMSSTYEPTVRMLVELVVR